MTAITGLISFIATDQDHRSGGYGRLYLGIGGREFRLQGMSFIGNYFERDSFYEFVMGDGNVGVFSSASSFGPFLRVAYGDHNDPRTGYPFNTSFLNYTPKYIRYEPSSASDNWNPKWAAALVYVPQFFRAFTVPQAFTNVWLSQSTGLILHLVDELDDVDPVLRRAREVGFPLD